MTNDINKEKQIEFQKSAESRSEFGELASMSEQTWGFGGACSTNYLEGGRYPAPSLQGPKDQIGKKEDKNETERNTKQKKQTRYSAHVRFSEKRSNRRF